MLEGGAAVACCTCACMVAASIKWLIDIIIEAASLLAFESVFVGTVEDGTVLEVVWVFDCFG